VIHSAFLAALLALAGCALAPNSIRPEFEHLSHLTQHFHSDGYPNYGADMVNVIAHWDIAHAYIEVGEGINLDRHYCDTNSIGEIQGPREQFTARIGYVFQVRP
jgi:hypothetical protein